MLISLIGSVDGRKLNSTKVQVASSVMIFTIH